MLESLCSRESVSKVSPEQAAASILGEEETLQMFPTKTKKEILQIENMLSDKSFVSKVVYIFETEIQ